MPARPRYDSLVATSRNDPFFAGLAAGERFPQRRSVPRYFLTWNVEVFEPITRSRFVAQTNVVSVKGCSIRTATLLDRNTIVKLQIKWREQSAEVWARVTGSPDEGLMGLAFLGPDQQHVFASWIAAELGL